MWIVDAEDPHLIQKLAMEGGVASFNEVKIVPLIDAYSETYMGKYSKIKPPKLNKRFLSTPELTNTYFKTLLTRMKAMKLHKDKHLQNIHDEIVALIRQTMYRLKLK